MTDLDEEATLRLNVISNLDQAIRDQGRLNELQGFSEGVNRKVGESLRKVRSELDGTSAATGRAAAANQKYAAGFDVLLDKLKKFKTESREAAQANVVGGSLDGNNKSALNKLSTKELLEYIAVDDARSTNAVSVAREIVSQREREAAATRVAVAQNIAGIEAEQAARNAAIAEQIAGADLTAAAQDARRYATPTPASRNSANRFDQADAQAGYSAQSTTDYSNSLKANAEAHNKVVAAAEHEAYAEDALRSARGKGNSSLITQRYALYDVATTYGLVSAALLASNVAAYKTAASYESAFTQVQRTSDGSASSIEDLRAQLVQLSTEIPLSFEELSKIAGLGNQLGVAPENIEQFTKVVAEFSATTGIAADQAAQDFGRIGNLLGLSAADYEKLGSAIVLVGRRSAATEPEIIAITERIAATANRAGFSTEQIIALSAALASLGVAPERAQGVLETYFNRLNNALADGGPRLQAFANYAGLTVEQTEKLARSDPNKFFGKLAASLGSMDSVSQTKALDSLGLSGIRAEEVFGRFAGRLDLFNKALDDTNEGYSKGTELSEQYAKIADDLTSRFQEMVNAANGLIDALSGGNVAGLAGLLSGITDILNGLRGIAANDNVRNIFTLVSVVSILIGVMFALKAANALATASTYALLTAQEALATKSAGAGIIGFVKQLLGYTAATQAATAATGELAAAQDVEGASATKAGAKVGGLSAGTKALGIAGLALLGLQVGGWLVGMADGANNATLALDKTTGSLKAMQQYAGDSLDGSIAALQKGQSKSNLGSLATLTTGGNGVFSRNEILTGLNSLLGGIPGHISGLTNAREGVNKIDVAIAKLVAAGNIKAAKKDLAELRKAAVDNGVDGDQFIAQFTQSNEALKNYSKGSKTAAAATTELGTAVEETTKKLRTAGDYAGDLGTIFSNAEDLRNGPAQAYDAISQKIIDMQKASSDAKKDVKSLTQDLIDLQATLAGLIADRTVNEYFLGVAQSFGDNLRAGVIAAQIAKDNADIGKTQLDITDKNQDLSDASDAVNSSLSGNSAAAIAARGDVVALVGAYQSYIEKLANSGLSQDELGRQVDILRGQFVDQLTQMGYNRDEVNKYAGAFDDFSTIVKNVPPNIEVAFNANPALQALNNFYNTAVQTAANAGAAAGDSYVNNYNARLKNLGSSSTKGGSTGAGYSGGGGGGGGGGGLAEGGYTGDGGKYDERGPVHAGEFVFSAAATRAIGVQNLAYAHDRAKYGGGRGYAEGGYVGNGGGSSSPRRELSIEDIMDAASARPVYLIARDQRVIAELVSAGNVATTRSA